MRIRAHSFLLLLVWALPAIAQQGAESLVIGPGDLLFVHVFREDDLNSKLRVKDAGTIALPLIGPVRVAGLPAADAASAIADRYSAGGFLNHPQVSVLIEESATQQVAVLGEVAHPGTVPLTSPRNLLDVLAQAGGCSKPPIATSRSADPLRRRSLCWFRMMLPLNLPRQVYWYVPEIRCSFPARGSSMSWAMSAGPAATLCRMMQPCLSCRHSRSLPGPPKPPLKAMRGSFARSTESRPRCRSNLKQSSTASCLISLSKMTMSFTFHSPSAKT